MAIKFHHIYFSYAPKSPFQYDALHDINLEIKQNSFTAVIGHTGSGKSTLVQHINALLVPTSGAVKVEDATFYCQHLSISHISAFCNLNAAFCVWAVLCEARKGEGAS